jgi:glycosyltransferase involved in cell wall biosynthesis
MNILYISNKPIYPKIDGGCVAMHNFLSCLLETKVNIKHFSISTLKHPFNIEEYPESIQNKITPEELFVDTRVTIKSAVKNIFSKGSYNVKRFYSEDINNTLKEHLQNNDYDKIILETIFLADYLKTFRKYSKAKIFVRSHNVEFKIWEKLAANENKKLKKTYLSKLAKDLKKVEINFLNQVDRILPLSKEDEEDLKKLKIQTEIDTIPVAISLPENVKNYDNQNFFHIGSMNWKPNIEAVQILKNSIFPSIQKNIKNVSLTLAGSFMEEEENTNDILYRGYIENINDFFSKEGILLSPILSGSGVRIKILESMANGTPVITTILGAEGISITPGKEILIAKNEKEFVEFAVHLSKSKEERKKIGQQARLFIANQHNKDNIIKQLSELLKK